jgi:hypothetical protein
MRTLAITAALVLFILLAQSAYALTGYIEPAKMILRVNITNSQVNMINGNIILRNQNNIPVNVSVTVSDFNAIVEDSDFVLQVNQTKTVEFIVIVTQAGYYSGTISAEYSATSGIPVTVPCEIQVFATSYGSNQNNNAPTQPVLSLPLNNSYGNTTSFTLKWSAATDADNDHVFYYYQIDDGNFSSPEVKGVTFNTEKSITVSHGNGTGE